MMTGNPLPQVGMGSTLSGTDVYHHDKLDGPLTEELGFTAYARR